MSEERAAAPAHAKPSAPRARRPTLGPRVVIRFHPDAPLTDALFAGLAAENHEFRLERNARGELEVMAPAGGEASNKNSEFNFKLVRWAKKRRSPRGLCFDSSGGFVLPNGAIRSPDGSWVAKDRWQALTPEQRKKVLPLCPGFVPESRSASADRSSGWCPPTVPS